MKTRLWTDRSPVQQYLLTSILTLTFNCRMATYRSFIFPGAEFAGDHVILDSRESHHLVRVFRARKNDSVELLNGAGGKFHGFLKKPDTRAAVVAIERQELFRAPHPRVTLLQAMPKGKAMDLILRMATEIGVSEIVPVFTDQGEVRLSGERMRSKHEKWRVTMVEACKQCGLPFLPELADPVPLGEALEGSGSRSDCLQLVASLETGSRPLVDCLRAAGSPGAVRLAVGPEGDFSRSEYAAMKSSGFRPVRLGANVLRAETAAAYLLSVVDQIMRTDHEDWH